MSAKTGRDLVGWLRQIAHLCVSDGTPLRALKLALVVGSVLVAINQWQALVGLVPMDWSKLLLTYCVPYLVSTYTSVAKDLAQACAPSVRSDGEAADGAAPKKAGGPDRPPERPT